MNIFELHFKPQFFVRKMIACSVLQSTEDKGCIVLLYITNYILKLFLDKIIKSNTRWIPKTEIS